MPPRLDCTPAELQHPLHWPDAVGGGAHDGGLQTTLYRVRCRPFSGIFRLFYIWRAGDFLRYRNRGTAPGELPFQVGDAQALHAPFSGQGPPIRNWLTKHQSIPGGHNLQGTIGTHATQTGNAQVPRISFSGCRTHHMV